MSHTLPTLNSSATGASRSRMLCPTPTARAPSHKTDTGRSSFEMEDATSVGAERMTSAMLNAALGGRAANFALGTRPTRGGAGPSFAFAPTHPKTVTQSSSSSSSSSSASFGERKRASQPVLSSSTSKDNKDSKAAATLAPTPTLNSITETPFVSLFQLCVLFG